MRFPVLVALAAAVSLAGCTQAPTTSTKDFTGAEKDVAEVVADLAQDAARNRRSHVCGEILTERLQQDIAGTSSCPSEVKKAFEDADDATLDVDDVTIQGSTAKAVVSQKSGDTKVRRTFELVKAGGAWRIDSFG